ncbi:LysR family transcriptional regulator [Streptomyces sp. NPDC005840]|uniref:LysR family transcriptional regulator n=1 Tax=Streptomyces sp. NPDC005840 TaxID=3157072 RepID=UPI0033E14EB7
MTNRTPAAVPPRPPGGDQLPAHADLNLLRTFLAVYRAGTFTAAAPLLGLSQPTVTAQIRALEQQTGLELFSRLPRGVEPTPYARELAARVAAPLDALARLEDGGAAPAPVRVAGPPELLGARVLPSLAPLVADGVELRVEQGLSEPLLDALRAGRHDLVVSTRRPRGRTLASVPLADEEYLLVAAPGWAGRTGTGGADAVCGALREVPLVACPEDLPTLRRYWRTAFGRQLTARPAVTVPDPRAVLAAVAAGAGYGLLPRALCRERLDSGRLALLHSPAEPPACALFLVRRPGTDANPDVARVHDRLVAAARAW